MLTSVSFKNLRCFKDFTLPNMTPMTLISGRNNIGKTTILEGVFLLLNHRNVNVFQIINGWRGIEHGGNFSYSWTTLFADMNMIAQKLCISATDGNGMTRTLDFHKDSQFSLTTFAKENKAQPILQPIQESYALQFVHHCEPGYESYETGMFYLTQTGMALNNDEFPHLPAPPIGLYISSNMNPMQQLVAEWIGKVEIENKKERLIRHLRLLYDDLRDIFVVSNQGTVSVFAKLNTGKTLPVRAMGDGINKLLHYLSVMIANPGGIFLLDEIETGFHYSFYSKVWELVAGVAKETGSQVVATTHSYECIEAALEGMSRVDPSLLTYVRLGKEESGIVPYSFSREELAYALGREMEIR